MPETPNQSMFRQWAAGLRFPQLMVVTLILLAIDLVIPDMIPFADEALLALLALLLGSLKERRPSEEGAEKPKEKNVTDRGRDSTRGKGA
jgi:hypothetical protein